MAGNETYVRLALEQQFQKISEDLSYDQAVSWLVSAIKKLPKKRTLVISLVGGAASGKSTMANSLCSELVRTGMAADVIATDDFNKGNRTWRKENYDAKAAMPGIDPKDVDPLKLKDFDLLNRKIDEIKSLPETSDKTVAVPTYNPLTGLAIDEGEEHYKHRIGSLDVLFVEGDFHPVAAPDLVVFVHLPDDDRLQNRLGRDIVHRGGESAKITESFNFRQRYQHTPVTLPIIQEADIVLDISISGRSWLYKVYTKKI